MVINTASWHYKLWNWTYEIAGGTSRASTNLCWYVQRIFWAGGFCLFFGLLTMPLWIWFGRPSFNDSPAVAWPGFRIAGRTIYPFSLMLPLIFLGLEGCAWHSNWKLSLELHAGVIGMLAVLAAITAFILFVNGDLDENETARLARAWIGAKTAGVCPLIEFKDELTSSDDPDEQTFVGGR